MNDVCFETTFATLTGYEPFPWQERLYQRLLEGRIPAACDVPTGLGKTAVIPIWLIALATADRRLPRRLIYIVNRRTVIDQPTSIAEQVLGRITSAGEEGHILGRTRKGVQALAGFLSDQLVAYSTTAGELADNEE